MVSFQTPFSEEEEPQLLRNNDQTRMTISNVQTTNSKKRKSCCDGESKAEEMIGSYRHRKAQGINFFSDVELHLETPLPSEWQRCLDIQSGEVHFYNTRTHKRTARDPRATPSPETPTPSDENSYGYMSLDLELNLLCGSPTSEKTNPGPTNKKSNKFGLRESSLTKSDQGMEMVATVCMQCHMLVMLCKSSPTCPNCKFTHPPYLQPSGDLFKPRLRLSC